MRVESAEQKRKKEEERREERARGREERAERSILAFFKLERQIPVIFGF
jgi:hypothetical protein